jgi:hypothetical protein
MRHLQLASGSRFTFEGPVEPLDIADVATALAKLCRFGGAVREFYSVAQHSVVVSRFAEEIAALASDRDAATMRHASIAGLLHDAHEMVLADICRPTKAWLARGGDFGALLDAAEQAIDVRLARGLGIEPPPPPIARYVKVADDLALAVERRDLMTPTGEAWPGILPASDIAAIPPLPLMTWREAEAAFLARWAELTVPIISTGATP